ncbi:unnamed protein product, partial [Mesorhabditis belari]|uniref:Uncharacterized protein n=1 Tax=Mesorhabditis belari TaxID=2138241 RepID=A0AAF3EID4_9BILA
MTRAASNFDSTRTLGPKDRFPGENIEVREGIREHDHLNFTNSLQRTTLENSSTGTFTVVLVKSGSQNPHPRYVVSAL